MADDHVLQGTRCEHVQHMVLYLMAVYMDSVHDILQGNVGAFCVCRFECRP